MKTIHAIAKGSLTIVVEGRSIEEIRAEVTENGGSLGMQTIKRLLDGNPAAGWEPIVTEMQIPNGDGIEKAPEGDGVAAPVVAQEGDGAGAPVTEMVDPELVAMLETVEPPKATGSLGSLAQLEAAAQSLEASNKNTKTVRVAGTKNNEEKIVKSEAGNFAGIRAIVEQIKRADNDFRIKDDASVMFYNHDRSYECRIGYMKKTGGYSVILKEAFGGKGLPVKLQGLVKINKLDDLWNVVNFKAIFMGEGNIVVTKNVVETTTQPQEQAAPVVPTVAVDALLEQANS